jgi:choline dehydrogenase
LQRSIDAKTQSRSSTRVNRHDRDVIRPDYQILANTAVSWVLFKGKTAAGVDFVGVRRTSNGYVTAKKEVIVAAGAIHTPQGLQPSGLGDARDLEKFGIKSIVDLYGLGQNLQDHLVLKVRYKTEQFAFLYRHTLLTDAPETSNLFSNGGSL